LYIDKIKKGTNLEKHPGRDNFRQNEKRRVKGNPGRDNLRKRERK
jgi:hypothetical protein